MLLTHKQTPWKEAYQLGKNTEITPIALKKCFDEKMTQLTRKEGYYAKALRCFRRKLLHS